MNIQDEDETSPDGLNDMDISPEEEFLPDNNSTSLETSALNTTDGNCSSTEQYINNQEDIVQSGLDEMFYKITEKVPLNIKIGQLSKNKTRTLAKCKICNKILGWLQRHHHKKEHPNWTEAISL